MNLEEVIEWIKQQKPLKNGEVRTLFAKYCVNDKEEQSMVQAKLLKHYLPLTLEYVKAYQHNFPGIIRTEEDGFDILEEGYFFLANTLHYYAYNDGYNFCRFYQKQLEKEMTRLKKEQKKEEKATFESFEHAQLTEESDPLDEFSVLCDQLYQAMKVLTPMEQRVVIKYYHLNDHLPQQLLEDVQKLQLSKRKQSNARQTGIKQLRKSLSNPENEMTYYQHANQLKVIK